MKIIIETDGTLRNTKVGDEDKPNRIFVVRRVVTDDELDRFSIDVICSTPATLGE